MVMIVRTADTSSTIVTSDAPELRTRPAPSRTWTVEAPIRSLI